MKEMKGMRKSEEIKDTGETEEMEVKEIEEMKGTRKMEEMKDIKKTKELEESENFENNPRKCSKCYQNNIESWCHPCNAKRFQNEFGKWTSEDREIDELIQQIQLNANKYQEIIEWIPFGRLENVTYLAKGGFGKVYKANWLDGFIYSYKKKNGMNLVNKLFGIGMIKNQLKFRGKNAIAIYGITKDPTENEYMMVMDYAEYGSLRNLLNNKFENLTWRKKYNILSKIVIGLTNIHELGLMHKDFHSGNIVNQSLTLSYITDFGLCKPVTENNPENIYGLIPYMAPETLNRGEYSQASDIYSFGMVMLEVLTSYPPYYNVPHNENLAMGICEEFKPEIKCEIPQFLKEIMEKCWNFEPLNRPTAKELKSQLEKYDYNCNIEIRKQVNKQINVANKSNKNFIQYDPNEMHPEAIYTSRYLPFVKSKKFETHKVLTSYPPYYNVPHNENLAMGICEEFKPEIKCEIPQFLKEIMEKCWNFEPLNRPTAKELKSQLEKYDYNCNIEIRKQVNKQINVANKSNKNFIQYDPNEMHPEAIYTSRYLPFVKSKKFETHIEEAEENKIQEN
ncbi:hypothetical protein Glove_140g84 [Diversispora epigaea]|uniref:Protein kinase domain-containing protein n=1 Tax=Diversispora epigaea TaxID=1348612 RepID=A0A397IV83_9GLOM|nr:hypothetical protein Glove_140g84 [Diversispora epigaea]